MSITDASTDDCSKGRSARAFPRLAPARSMCARSCRRRRSS